jgi:hypothetical protein
MLGKTAIGGVIITQTKETTRIAEVERSIVRRSANSGRLLSTGLWACALFATLNVVLLIAFNQSRNFWNSAEINAARKSGNFAATSCFKNWSMFLWGLLGPAEKVLDSGVSKLSAIDKPDVILLGSSLVYMPLWFADHGDTLPVESSYYFRSNALEAKCNSAKKLFDLSVPLMNASDAYRLVNSALKGDSHRPLVLVYGVGPRDFYDALFTQPRSTMYFEFLSTLSDFTTNRETYFPTGFDELEYFGKHAYTLFDRRVELLTLGKSAIKELLHLNRPVRTSGFDGRRTTEY